MATDSENLTTVAADASKLSRQQKLAVLLIMLGPDSAAQILKNLDEVEVESVCSEMSKFSMVSQELQHEILKEFTEVALHAGTAIRGGAEFTQSALEKGLGLFKASNIISRVSPNRAPLAAMAQIAELEARQIFNLIKQEQAQTIALVVSYLTPEKAAQLMGMLRPETREQVIERLATLAPTPIEVVERIVEVLNQKLGGKHTRALNQTGGLKAAANLLNAVDKNLSKSLLISLEERNPELGLAIRQKMFTFEDLASLDSIALQRVLREVEMRDLAVALKTASEQLKTVLLGSISKRAAETVAEEISFMGPLKLRDIEAAQLRIIEVLRRLEAEGEIDLGETKEKTMGEVLV
jgi:flagellar motor switch protein FliG